jgi:hypothetical protein
MLSTARDLDAGGRNSTLESSCVLPETKAGYRRWKFGRTGCVAGEAAGQQRGVMRDAAAIRMERPEDGDRITRA